MITRYDILPTAIDDDDYDDDEESNTSYRPLPIHPLSNIQTQSIQPPNLESLHESIQQPDSLNKFMGSAFDSPEEKRKREDEAFLQELESKRLPMDIDIDRQTAKTEKEFKKLQAFNIEEEDKSIRENAKKKSGRPQKKNPLPERSSQQITRTIINELTPTITKRGYPGLSDTQLEAMKKDKLTKRKELYKKGFTVNQIILFDNKTLDRLYYKYK
jgi:hypothetical protein